MKKFIAMALVTALSSTVALAQTIKVGVIAPFS